MNQVAKMKKETISPWMMVGKLLNTDMQYEGTKPIDQCIRGVKRLGVTWEQVQSTSRVRRIVDEEGCVVYTLEERDGLMTESQVQ